MMNVNEIFESLQDLEYSILEQTEKVFGRDLGLDPRCGIFHVDKDGEFVMVDKHDRRRVDYYGGLEYVDEENILTLNEYVLYMADHGRIARMIKFYHENKESDNV